MCKVHTGSCVNHLQSIQIPSFLFSLSQARVTNPGRSRPLPPFNLTERGGHNHILQTRVYISHLHIRYPEKIKIIEI